jgi:uncharacterized protein (DUF58 family)
VLREYERDGAETRWICLDLRAEPGDAAEVAVEVAASLAADAVAEGRSFALAAGDTLVEAGEGPGQLDRVLDVLARVDFAPDAPAPAPPSDPAACLLVSVDGAPGFGAAVVVGRDAVYEEPRIGERDDGEDDDALPAFEGAPVDWDAA